MRSCWAVGRLLAAIMGLLATAGAADVCSATSEKLVTACGGVCSDYMPCSVYNASSACSGCEDGSGSGSGSDGDACSFFCFSPYEDQATALVFFVPFGAYESEEEAAARAADSAYDSELDAFTDDYTAYAYSGNDIMAGMGALELNPATTSFKLIGGTSSSGSLKSKVALLTFDDGFLTAMTNVTTVTLRNFNLKEPADELPELLPSTLADLTLVNTLLYSLPSGLSSFSALTTLTMDMNYVTTVDQDDAVDTLKTLSLAQNNITSFDAVFPSLETLDLSDNNLIEIPASVYEHTSLSSLSINGNPFTEAAFSAAQVAFLQNLTSLALTNDDFASGLPCTSADYVIIHSITVCLVSSSSESSSSSSEASESATTASGSSHTGAIVGGVVGGVAALTIIVIATYCCYRRNKLKNDGKPANGTLPPAYYSAAGMSKTVLAASGWTDGTNGGFVSLWVDPELLAVQVKADDIEDLHKIGGGAFGEVWLVRYRNSQLLASKRLRRDQLTRDRTMAFVEEIKLIATLEHPKIVRFVGAAWSIESDLQALSEYMENGDLRSYLVEPSAPRPWSALKLQLAIDVAEALVYVHSFIPPLVHRDLKSRNVLLSGDMQAKLTDFGSTRFKSEDNTMTQGVGTGRWLAPEVLAGSQDYGPAADIFSFGVVLSELDSHAIPYDDARGTNGNTLVEVAILQMVALGQLRPSFGDACPAEIRELALRCLSQEPEDRPSAPEVAYALRMALNALFPATAFV